MENSCEWYDPSCALKWLQDEFKAFWVWLYDGMMVGLSNLIDSIPVPSFMAEIQPIIFPASVGWAIDVMNIQFGVSVVVAAYTARFILRRIPFIG